MPRVHFIFLSRGTNPRTLLSTPPGLACCRKSTDHQAGLGRVRVVSRSDEPAPPEELGTPSCVCGT